MSDIIKLTIILPNIPNAEVVAIKGLEHLSAYLEIPEEKISEARILVTEAIINALEHANSEHPEVTVTFSGSKEKLIIFVEDFGIGFEPEKVEEPNFADKIQSKNKRGWGLKLMKSMSDDFLIESGKDGTKITMTKNLI